MKTKRLSLILFICACWFLNLQAQISVLGKVENELVANYKKVTEWRFSTVVGYYDSMAAANEKFTVVLRQLIKKHPATISYPFSRLSDEGVQMATSADGNLRIYSWDTWMGGTMHFFDNLYQFRDGKKVQTAYFGEDETDAKSSFDTIFQTRLGKETIYLCRDHTVGSTRDKGGNIKLYKIGGGKLQKANLIETSSGLHHSINIYFDMVLTEPEEDWPMFNFDAATKTIFVPLILANGKPSGKYIHYRFDGKYFRKVK